MLRKAHGSPRFHSLPRAGNLVINDFAQNRCCWGRAQASPGVKQPELLFESFRARAQRALSQIHRILYCLKPYPLAHICCGWDFRSGVHSSPAREQWFYLFLWHRLWLMFTSSLPRYPARKSSKRMEESKIHANSRNNWDDELQEPADDSVLKLFRKFPSNEL